MKLQRKYSTILVWAFFIVLLIYALLRAWIVEPIHDEVATYFHYIEPGKIFGEGVLLDANNHLLNSWLGRFSYEYFGTHFFLFRFPSIVCFCIYFWSARKLTPILHPGIWGDLCFVALNTIPWIFDYFSYTRGYGMAIGFFMCALLQLHFWLTTRKTVRLLFMLVLLYLTVLSNFTYLITSMLIICFVIFLSILSVRKTGFRHLLVNFILVAAFAFVLKPLILFTFDLKNAGALYYGSLDGLWWVTGKTLSRYVLFYDADWLRFLYVLIGIVGAALLVLQWKKESWQKFLSSPSFWLSALIGGNILAILFLAKVMQVNYPEDRAGMYLIPLSILAFTALFAQNKWLKYCLLVLLFFPVSFLLKLNLNTSVFSPDDRMTDEFYATAMKDIQPDQTISVYPIMWLPYALQERNNKAHTIKHIINPQKDFVPSSDLILTKTTYLFPKDDISAYKVIARDPASTYIALKRKQPFHQTVLFESKGKNSFSNAEFITIFDGKIQDSWKKQFIQINVKGDFYSKDKVSDFNLTINSNDSTDQIVRHDYENLRWYYGINTESFTLNFPYAAKQLEDNESRLIIYIWNPERKKIRLTNPLIQIVALK